MNSEDSPSPTGLESYLVRLAWHSTLGLAVVVVMGMASPELLGPVVVVFSSLLFALGLGMLALGLLAGLRRSRDEEVTVTGLFLLYGSAPLKVRKVFGWALGLQLVGACAGALGGDAGGRPGPGRNQLQHRHESLRGEWPVAARTGTLEEKPQLALTPSVISYNAATSACEKGGQWQLALDILEGMS